MTIIAIDGPSGSGKSTISRLLAEKLNLPYLDTGAMYRAVGMTAVENDIEFTDASILTKIAAELEMELDADRPNGKIVPHIVITGRDCTSAIRSPEITQASSAIAIHPGVREQLVRRQREWVRERGGAVVEGRDIGSVVFPDADLKVFLTAHHEERIRRRQSDPHAPGFANLSEAEAKHEIVKRDHRDSTRNASPLTAVEDALIVDTSGQGIDEVVDLILATLGRASHKTKSSA